MAEIGYFESLALGMIAGDAVTRDWPRVAAEAGAARRQQRESMEQADYINALLAENEALRADNAGLQANIDVLQDYIAKYKAWARAEIARLENR